MVDVVACCNVGCVLGGSRFLEDMRRAATLTEKQVAMAGALPIISFVPVVSEYFFFFVLNGEEWNGEGRKEGGLGPPILTFKCSLSPPFPPLPSM